MKPIAKQLVSAGILLLAAAAPLAVSVPAQAANIKQVVNGTAITDIDIQHRAAFLRLQGRSASTSVATEEMIDQTLRSQEMARLNVRITQQAVDDSYARFAKSNKMSPQQLDSILAQAGVTKEHFKDFIRVQMGWGQAVSARGRAENGGAQQNAIREIIKKGGSKPTATEYILQQVILVVPERDRRAILGKRKQEAQSLRAKFSSCDTTRQVVRGMIDVTVRDLGRVIEQELPPDWEKQVKATSAGNATAIRETAMGVEFLAVCSTRQVSDDRVAELAYQKEQAEKGGNAAEELSKKYTAELRERARITAR